MIADEHYFFSSFLTLSSKESLKTCDMIQHVYKYLLYVYSYIVWSARPSCGVNVTCLNIPHDNSATLHSSTALCTIVELALL